MRFLQTVEFYCCFLCMTLTQINCMVGLRVPKLKTNRKPHFLQYITLF